MSDLDEKLDGILARFAEVERSLQDPSILSTPARMKELGIEHKELSHVVELINQLRKIEKDIDDLDSMLYDHGIDDELRKMAGVELDEARINLEDKLQELRRELLPKDHRDKKDVIIEIRAGTGGDEAAIFAGDLFRMYSRYAEARNWKTTIISESPLPIGHGYKEIIIEIRGEGAYSRLKFEGGTHRVQRVPLTESSGRIHTSAATVAVMVEPDPVDLQIDENDLRIDTYRASSAGGQHVNKTDSAIRITHLPSGLVVTSQDQRSQHQNKEKAMMLMRAYLLERMEEERADKIRDDRRSQVSSGDRSAKIRTYNWPQNRVTDHRIGMDRSLLKVIEGDIDPIIDQLQLAHEAEQLANVS
ncbi:MAG: peptide chain release factor 1 [bacterium]|nr:peptide chain release factor 1 [bacterium]